MRSAPPSVCRLSEMQPSVSAWELKDRIWLVHQLAEQVESLHKEGRFHRGISLAAVLVDTQSNPTLDSPERLVVLGGDYWDPQIVPPELSRAGVLELPDSISAATAVLQDHRVSLEPRSIDVYQLGALLCQVAANCGVREYMYDPQVIAGVPRPLQAVIERTLRRSADDRMNNCSDLQSALREAIAAISAESPSSVDGESGSARRSEADRDTAWNDTDAIEARRESDLPFSRLGQFRVIAKIGQGGMGDVYRAVDDTLGRDVALKVLPSELTRSPAFVKRFQAEAMAVAKISHPNIVPIYSIGQDQGRHYFVMQLVEGASLQTLLDEGHAFELATTLKIIKQCLDGLGAAHRRRLVHRDVKPGNVLFDSRTGVAMLVDFGLVRTLHGMSRMTESGVIMGTVDYIAPEQARGLEVDERADQYSLGVMAYELLAGRLPFTADSPTAMIFQHAYESPYPLWKAAPHVPRAVVDIVMRMMAKEARQRYPDVNAALADLRSFETGKPIARDAAVGWTSGRSFLAEKPVEDDDAQELSSVAGWINPQWWQKLQQFALSAFRTHAPEFLRQLQSTQMQIDAAVAEHQRRYDQLADLLQEGENAAADFAARRQSYIGAAVSAEQRLVGADDDTARQDVRQDLDYCRQAAADIEKHERQISQDVADLRLFKAQALAKLLELTNQRDLLRARLKAAHVQGAFSGKPARRSWLRWLVAAAFLLFPPCVALRWYLSRPSPPITVGYVLPSQPVAAARTSKSKSDPAEPQPVNMKSDASSRAHDIAREMELKPYILDINEGGVEFNLDGAVAEWGDMPFSATVSAIVVRPGRLFGNLDPRKDGPPKPGWALYTLPAETQDRRPEITVLTDKELAPGVAGFWKRSLSDRAFRKNRLAFAYMANDGQVRQVVGPIFNADLWWPFGVKQDANGRIKIELGRQFYLQLELKDRLRGPAPGSFWLGELPFGTRTLSAQFGALKLHAAKVLPTIDDDMVLAADFTVARDNLLIDASGMGHHAKLAGPSLHWFVAPERFSPAALPWSAPSGEAFVLQIGPEATVELLETEGQFGLDSDFTSEMWFRTEEPYFGQIPILDNRRELGAKADPAQRGGWSLTLTNQNEQQTLMLHFPNGATSVGTMTSEAFPWKFRWHHLAFCNTRNARQIYLDGKPLIRNEGEQAEAILANWKPSRVNLAIGRHQPGDNTEQFDGTMQVRSFRFSSGRRYDKPFEPPASFIRDERTVVLLDIEHQSGFLVQDLSTNRHDGLARRTKWLTVKKLW